MSKRRKWLVLLFLVGFGGPFLFQTQAESKQAELPPAKSLVDLRVDKEDGGMQYLLMCDGAIPDYVSFPLSDPPRIVVDILNVSNAIRDREMTVGSPEIAKVRLGSHYGSARVVFDVAKGLETIPPYSLKRQGDKLIVAVGETAREITKERYPPRAYAKASEDLDRPLLEDSTAADATKVDSVSEADPEKEVAGEAPSVNSKSSSDESPSTSSPQKVEGSVVEKAEDETKEKRPQEGSSDEMEGDALTLEEAIRIAQENNFNMLSAKEAINGAEQKRRSALTDFFPKLSVEGTLARLSEQPTTTVAATPPIPVLNVADPDLPVGAPIGVVPGTPSTTVPVGKRDSWALQGSVTQPVFTGGALWNQYKLTEIGVESAQVAETRTGLDLSLEVVRAYFDVLNSIEQKKVADFAVKLLENQRDVSQGFYDVGMIPKNDLLQTEVQLAEVIREQIRAENTVELAKARFNLVLQRPVQTPVKLKNILEYKSVPVPLALEELIEMAHEKRVEIKEAQLKIAADQREVGLAQSEFFPQVQVSYNLFKTEGRSFSALEEGWTLEAGASWTFWEWGKTHHEVSAARSQVLRDRYALLQLKDKIAVEVKEAWLALRVTERNTFVAKKAIEQGEENFRMNQERYKEQVGTILDVLSAQNLLTKAQTDYFNALRNYNVALAALRRAVGLKAYEPVESTNASATEETSNS